MIGVNTDLVELNSKREKEAQQEENTDVIKYKEEKNRHPQPYRTDQSYILKNNEKEYKLL